MSNTQSHLVVTRRDGESILIGDDIEVQVSFDPVRKNQIKVGIRAPRNVKILRSELLDTNISN